MLKESDIMHENGPFWVCRKVSKNATIAPIGSVYYALFEVKGVASYSTGYVSANLDRAIKCCDNRAATVQKTDK